MSIAMYRIRIGDIYNRLKRVEANAIRSAKAIGHDSDITILRIVSIHLIGEFWLPSKLLVVSITRIREPECAILGHNYIVHGVEVSTMEVGNNRMGWCITRHQVDTTSPSMWRALSTEEDSVVQVHSSFRHINARWRSHLLPVYGVYIIAFLCPV